MSNVPAGNIIQIEGFLLLRMASKYQSKHIKYFVGFLFRTQSVVLLLSG